MNIERIKQAKTDYLGKHILYFEEVASTQDLAKELVEQQLPNGSLIITDYQTQGKGTKGRKWLASKEKNIMMTLVLYPNTNISKLEGLTIHIAEVIRQAIYELYGYTLTIKKPNDLLLNGKKIAGILTQATIQKEQVTHLYIGIGFNVNETSFAKEVQDIATSLKQEYHKDFEREEIVCKVLEKIENVIKLIK